MDTCWAVGQALCCGPQWLSCTPPSCAVSDDSIMHRASTPAAACPGTAHHLCRPGPDINLKQVFKTPEIKLFKIFYWYLQGPTEGKTGWWTTIILLYRNGLFLPVRQRLEQEDSSQQPFQPRSVPCSHSLGGVCSPGRWDPPGFPKEASPPQPD